MKVLIAANWLPVTVAQHFAKAFKQEGHEVVTVGPAYGHWMPWTGGLLVLNENKPDIAVPANMQIQYADIAGLVGAAPDMVMCFEPHPIIAGLPASVKSIGYACDNHVRKMWPGEYDTLYVAHSWGDGADAANAKWLPVGYDPELNYDMELQRDVDVAIVGCIYQHRLDAVVYMLSHNVTVNLAWGRINPEWNAMYNRARAALCFSYKGDLSDRILANLAQGCLVVCDRGIKDLEAIGIKEWQHCLAFENHAELVERIEQARDDAFRYTMTEQAKRAVLPHTWRARVQTMVG